MPASPQIAITAEHLSKCYQIYDRPQDRLKEAIVPRLQRIVGRTPTRYARAFWALHDVSFTVARGEALGVIGRNGTGKSTLLGMLLGEIPLLSGERRVGRATVIGAIGQERAAYDGEVALVEEVAARTGLTAVDARTLLAKFGLGADHISRACSSLSPGERTRAHLAELQARGVNVLILDEPTNHLDLEAVEQLERALAEFDGALVVVSHDRRFLQRIAPTRTVTLRL
jgi:ATPase subunit of ABC transporter with duplicated ATPase domains